MLKQDLLVISKVLVPVEYKFLLLAGLLWEETSANFVELPKDALKCNDRLLGIINFAIALEL